MQLMFYSSLKQLSCELLMMSRGQIYITEIHLDQKQTIQVHALNFFLYFPAFSQACGT